MRLILLSLCLLFAINAVAQDDKLKNDTAGAKVTPSATEVYTYTDQMPEPGYDITKYLSEHLQYPDSAFKYSVQGRVILKFIVNEDGSISNCRVEKGVGAGCDEEALKVVSGMPNWKAGMKNGQMVRVWTMLPVSFVLTAPRRKPVYNYADQMPIIGCNYYKYIAENLHYPDSAKRSKIQQRVLVRFVVNEDGTVSNEMLLNSGLAGCGEEAIRLIHNMPHWTPGKKKGVPVNVWYNLSVPFEIKPDSLVLKSVNDTSYKEDMPFPPFDMNLYVSNNLRYPDSARDNNVTGRVAVRFIVNENGSVSDCSVVRSVCGALDQEALRVIKNMPAWIPGMQNGKPVKVYFTQPITFNLEGGPYRSKKKMEKPANYIYDLLSDHPDKWPNANYDYTKYLSEHVQYPAMARERNIEGEVIVKFVVNKDSTINDCQIMSHLGGGCDTEAIRVIKSMPKWSPGIFNKKPISAEQFATVPFYPSEEERRLVESKKIYTYVEQMPASGYDYNEYIIKHIKYPDTANRKNITGRVIVRFIVTETGAIDSVCVLRGIGCGCDEEAIRVVKEMPPWKPGKQSGKPVKVYFTMPVSFSKNLSSAEIEAIARARKAAIPKRNYDFLKYLEDSLRYPTYARQNNIEGDVNIKFAVNEDGIVSDCKITKGIGYGCDEEALRLVQNMPSWTPGQNDGKGTQTYFWQSVSFHLDNGKSKKKKGKKRHPGQ